MLTAGARLGPYEIVGPLGAGGMGEVYRARDTRLDRTVAIKVLAAPLAADPKMRERFEREARAISSLNHPHICALYDIGTVDSEPAVDFLVLEYLEGETLAERLARSGALAPPDAMRVAIEICDALDRAHRSGIVHRDLKPANVFLARAGGASAPPGVKLLDFGLAKSAAPVVATTALSMLPTTPPNLTAQGAILGTFQYMAPEQIEGLEADARTDIFAFGAVLFEMLTGRPAFEGKTRASLLGAILKDEPPRVSTLEPAAPKPLDRIVSTCVAKDPDERYQSARDLLRDLKWAAAGVADTASRAPAAAPRRADRLAWYVAAAAVCGAAVAALWAWRTPATKPTTASAALFTIPAPDNTTFGGPLGGGTGSATQLAVSPDGHHLAFVAGKEGIFQLWLRPIASLDMVAIPGTEGAMFPFWSPDNRFVAFFAAGKLKKVQIAGGPPAVLCDAVNGRGGAWNRDNVILFSSGSTGLGLMRVSSAGGAPATVTTLDPATGETNHRWPYFLPDGRHFLYTATTGTCCPAVRPATVRVSSLDSPGSYATLLQAESAVSYSAGHLLFVRDDTLMAQPFDPDRRELHSDPFPLAQHIGSEGSRYISASVSESGTLVYGRGSALASLQLTWVDRAGALLGTVGEPALYINLALSPDERRAAVALATVNPDNRDIWIIDLARNVPTRVTFDPAGDGSPIWSPDGSRVAFQGARDGRVSLRQKVINSSVADEALLQRSGFVEPSDWSADGRMIAFTNAQGSATPSAAGRSGNVTASSDIWVLPLFGDRKPFPVVQSEFAETSGVFSPDGRWIAYTGTEGITANVYVQPLQGGGKYQVSRDGGSHPLWRADGRELFYIAPDATMMAVPVAAGNQFEAGAPQALFDSGVQRLNAGRLYGVTKDGKRFIVARRNRVINAAPITAVINWLATVQK